MKQFNSETHPGYFITATDTGVGKTVIAAGLGMLFRENGYDVGIMKPLQSGGEDTGYLINAAGCNDNPELINPYCLRDPLAPAVAAAREGTVIDIDRIKHCFSILQGKHNIMIVEGIGGILVPIRDDYFVSDLILDFKLPVIIVTRPSLGTINHTMLTITHLQAIGANIAGIIINYAENVERSIAEDTNPHVIKNLAGVRLLGTLPYIPGIDVKNQATKGLVRSIKKYIDL